LVSNALDAAEAAGLPPRVSVRVDQTAGGDRFSVADAGPGIPWAVVESSLDYTTRTTDKAYYVSPTRGRQGNALKTLWAPRSSPEAAARPGL
jgi:DNA topoisomerase VI subunit B